MKVAELEGNLLDYWVAKGEGYTALWNEGYWFTGLDPDKKYSPSTRWEQGGPILYIEQMSLKRCTHNRWIAWKEGVPNACEQEGTTPLIAICRCFVASKYGDEVPDEVSR